MLKLEHTRITRSILWLLMTWLLASPGHKQTWEEYRADSRFAPSQWETALLCNDVWHALTGCKPRISPGIDGSLNYANPVYGVATICHQVRWLRWGHPSLFHTATSLLIWYKMFWVRDISYKLLWMEFINMFSVYVKSGTHSRINW